MGSWEPPYNREVATVVLFRDGLKFVVYYSLGC